MKKSSLLIIFISLALTTFAQDKRAEKNERKEARRQKINELVRQAEEGVLIYHKQNIFGIQLKTNGYGAFYEMARMKTNRKATIYRIDFGETKEHKEEKTMSGDGFIFGNPYIYGKLNYFYPLTLGYGQQYIFGQKGNKNGVAVAGIWNAGLSLGLLRPYYLNVSDPQSGEREIKYTPQDSALFLDQSAIISGGGFGKGWGEIKIKPGAFAKVAMRFDYGRFNEAVSGLEIGMSAEVYADNIPILFMQEDNQVFFHAYIAILFGRRK